MYFKYSYKLLNHNFLNRKQINFASTMYCYPTQARQINWILK